MSRWQVVGKYPFLGVSVLVMAIIGVAVFSLKTASPLQLAHQAGKSNQPPQYLGEIKLKEEAKPAWVYSTDTKLYLSYFEQDQVEIRTPEGQLVKSFPATLEAGSGTPQGMAVVGKRMLIADYAHQALVFFTPEGKYLESFNTTPDGAKLTPVGVAVYNRVFYVADAQKKGWLALGDDGVFINYALATEEKAKLDFPYGMAVTDDGRVIVTDPQAGKIKVYACPGWYAYDIQTQELGLKNPQGIVLDGLGRLHVVDNGTGKVFVYDNRGKYLFQYGKDLAGPSTIAVNKKLRTIYIANTEKKYLSVWGY